MKKAIIAILAFPMLISLGANGRSDAPVRREEDSAVYPFAADELLTVDLRTGGSLTVMGEDSREARIEILRRGDAVDQAVLTMERTGGGLSIGSYYLTDRGGSGGIDITVRLNNSARIKLETLGGDVGLQNLDGTFQGKTLGGDIVLENLSGRVDLETLGGDITLSDTRLAGRVKTLGGDVRIAGNNGALDADTLGGKVTIVDSETGEAPMGEEGKPVVMDSLGGNIKVDLAPDGIRAKTLGGDIRVGKADLFARVETLGGDITLSGVNGYIEAQTMGGEIRARIIGSGDGKDRHAHLSSLGGDLELAVPENLDMTVEITLEISKKGRRNYRINTDFDLAIEEREATDAEKRRNIDRVITARGTFGDGSNQIIMDTVNGDVTLAADQ